MKNAFRDAMRFFSVDASSRIISISREIESHTFSLLYLSNDWTTYVCRAESARLLICWVQMCHRSLTTLLN